MTKQNGSLHPVASDTEGSSDAPASSYYDEDDVRSRVPEAGADKLLKAGGLNALEVRIVSTERQQAIAGVDLLWLLLTDVTDLFNPVRHSNCIVRSVWLTKCGLQSCSSVFTMRSRVTLRMLAEYMTKQFDKFPRYRQRLERTGRWFHGAVFVDDPDFDIYKHIRVARLPEPAGKRELEELVRTTAAAHSDLSLICSCLPYCDIDWKVHWGTLGHKEAISSNDTGGELP